MSLPHSNSLYQSPLDQELREGNSEGDPAWVIKTNTVHRKGLETAKPDIIYCIWGQFRSEIFDFSHLHRTWHFTKGFYVHS